MFKVENLTFVVIAIILGWGIWWSASQGPLRDPAAALDDFYEARDRMEGELMDPLILCGHRVVPLVIADLPNKQMRLRRYAIGFLGNGRYVEALPTLENILAEESEIYYFRADALEAINSISQVRARTLAPSYVNGDQLLGTVARSIVGGKGPERERRTYWQAFMHQDD
jgi:hypothetical protein